jgi:hypothetical protein
MARPRTPTEVLDLKGSFDKHPERRREVGPKSTSPLGEPPTYFNTGEAVCWYELAQDTPPGVLTGSDRWTVEAACRLMAKFRADWLTGAEFGQLNGLLSKMGKTPSDRSKIHGTAPEETASPYDEFLN